VISAALLGRGRAMSESLMPDTCKVTRGGGPAVLNEETGKSERPDPVVVYEGPFRSRGVNTAAGEIDAAAQLLVETDASVSFPVSADTAQITKNDTVEWTSSEFDPGLVGRTVRITGPFAKTSHAVARRFRVEETT
jgi:hypothetical protein